MRRLGGSVIACIALSACHGEPAAPKPPAPVVTPPRTTADAAITRESAIRARFAGVGHVHGAPISLDADRWLVFVGDDAEARAAWVATPQGLSAIDGWPPAVRVAGAEIKTERVEISVLTRAFLDQEAGIRGSVTIDVTQRRVTDLRGVTSLAALPMPNPPGAREPGAPSPLAARRALVTSPDSTALPWLRERAGAEVRELGEAPLGVSGGGVVAVGLAPPDPGDRGAWVEPYLAIVESGSARVFPLRPFGPDERPELRFLDFDGDGRTDVLFRTTFVEDGVTRVSSHAVHSPGAQLGEDPASAPAFALAALTGSIDEAARALLAIPVRGVATKDACAITRQARTVSGLRSVAAEGARVITFAEPGDPAERPAVVAASDASPGTLRDLRACPLLCARDRPFCTFLPEAETDRPHMEYFWFTWEGGRAKLAGLARYTGS